MFDKTYCINLDRRNDRWDTFFSDFPLVDWIVKGFDRFKAVDGKENPPPATWKRSKGAWGCLQSHTKLIEKVVEDKLNSVLIFEDDAVFVPNFKERANEFLAAVPSDWEILYFGGIHTEPPKLVNDKVCRAMGVKLTHAYALRGQGIKKVHCILSNFQNCNLEVDELLRDLCPRAWVYAPTIWLVNQSGSESDIEITREVI